MADGNLDLGQVVQAVTDVKRTFEEFKSTLDTKSKEAAKGYVDPLLDEKLSKINEALDKKQEMIDQLYAANRRKTLLIDGKQVDPADLDAKALSWAQMCAKARGTRVDEFDSEKAREYKQAFMQYMRKDDRVLEANEQKALSVGSDPDGGYVVDPDTSGRIVLKQFETSPMRQYASVQVISTDALEGLYDLDEAAAGWVSEKGARTETATPKLGAWRIPVHEMYAEPRATQKLLDDAFIDMENWLAGKVAEKFSRVENAAFISGDGVDKPRGLLTYPAGTSLPGQIEQFKTGANGDFAADPAGADVFVNVVYGLKSNYRNNAVWFMNRSTTAEVRKLKDSDGNPLWQPSIQAGHPSTLMGYPLASFEDMPAINTGTVSIGFGDLAEAYQIVDRIGIRVLRDPYTAKPYVKFYTTKRVGGDVLNFEAVKLINFSQ